MKTAQIQIVLLKLLVVLMLINYQVVTVICDDFVGLKYLRDVLLIVLIVSILYSRQFLRQTRYVFFVLALAFFLAFAALKTGNVNTSVVFIRRYLFPLFVFWTLFQEDGLIREKVGELIRFIFNLLTILAAWGIFQAYVLGPSFLMRIGYPTMYSNAYKTITLKSSFYFGNLGIQRVVSTVSNSNVFALILGCTIIVLLLNYKVYLTTTIDKMKFLVIACAYILTFSRANFLAMLVVAFFVMWKYIPGKIYFFMAGLSIVWIFIVLYVCQNETGITHKLVNWAWNSLTFQESSAAGRTGIWQSAFQKVKNTPLGIGFGKTGSWAQGNGAEVFWHCENSYLAMALDMGWGGCVCYLIFLMEIAGDACLRVTEKRWENRTVVSILVYFMIAMMFSNHIYDMEAVTYIYLLLGLFLVIVKQTKGEENEVYGACVCL